MEKYPSAHQRVASTRRGGIYVLWDITQPLIRKNEILPFAATRMLPGSITLSEVGPTEKHKDMWNLKSTTDESMCKTETDSQT